MGTKITALPSTNAISSDDLLVIVDSPAGGAQTRKITVENFFMSAPDISVSNTVTVSNALVSNTGNSYFSNVHISYSETPSQSLWAADKGKIWFDSNYLYVAVDTNYVRRIPLQDF